MATQPTYAVYVDWDDDGTVGGVGENVTARLRGQPGVTITRGRSNGRRLGQPMIPTARIRLDNQTGDYTPNNTGSPLFGLVKPGRSVRISALTPTVVQLFTGRIDDLAYGAHATEQYVDLYCVGHAADLIDRPISTPALNGGVVSDAVTMVLDAAGWPTAGRIIDPSSVVLPLWWAAEIDAWTALLELVATEGGDAHVDVGPSSLKAGDFRFTRRHARSIDTASLVPQATWHPETEPAYSAVIYDVGWRDIVNRAEITATPRTSTARDVVWEYGGPVVLNGATARTITAHIPDGFTGAETPTEAKGLLTVDSGNAGLLSVSLSRQSGGTTDITLTHTGGGAANPIVVGKICLRAVPYESGDPVTVAADDTASQAAYGVRTFTIDSPWLQSPVAAADLVDGMVAIHANPRPALAVTFRSGHPDRIIEQLERDIGDRVTVQIPSANINEDFHIERVTHQIDEAGMVLTTTFDVTAVRPEPVAPANLFRFGVGHVGVDRVGW